MQLPNSKQAIYIADRTSRFHAIRALEDPIIESDSQQRCINFKRYG